MDEWGSTVFAVDPGQNRRPPREISPDLAADKAEKPLQGNDSDRSEKHQHPVEPAKFELPTVDRVTEGQLS
jgi:hypothetical protein